MTTQHKIEWKLNQAYNHIKPYIKQDEVLPKVCGQCEQWMGDEHNYEECRNKACFKCWLAYVYLRWETSYE